MIAGRLQALIENPDQRKRLSDNLDLMPLATEVSGNRDEEVFKDPFRFAVGRDPNKHLAFGYGVHFCLSAALARMISTTFIGGLKHLPIRSEVC